MAIGILILLIAIFLIVNTVNGQLPKWIHQITTTPPTGTSNG